MLTRRQQRHMTQRINCKPLRQDSSRNNMCFVFSPCDSKQTYGTRFLAKRMHMACRCLCTVAPPAVNGPVGWPKVCCDLLCPNCGVRRSVFEGAEEFFVPVFMGRRNLHPVLNIQSYLEGRSKKESPPPDAAGSFHPGAKQSCARSLRGKGGSAETET